MRHTQWLVAACRECRRRGVTMTLDRLRVLCAMDNRGLSGSGRISSQQLCDYTGIGYQMLRKHVRALQSDGLIHGMRLTASGRQILLQDIEEEPKEGTH